MHSKSMHRKAKTSVRRSTGLPRACSGLMHPGVPASRPASGVSAAAATVTLVVASVSTDSIAGRAVIARPKSSTFAVPSSVIWTFSGLISRCTIPRLCAASSAEATWAASSMLWVIPTGPRKRRSLKLCPSMNSRTRKLPSPSISSRS